MRPAYGIEYGYSSGMKLTLDPSNEVSGSERCRLDADAAPPDPSSEPPGQVPVPPGEAIGLVVAAALLAPFSP